jgi:hypothetical protein
MKKRNALVFGASAVLSAGAVVLPAGAALAAPGSTGGPQTQTLSCTGGLGDLVIRTSNNNSSDNGGWSVAQIVNGGTGHLIPTAFTFTAHDDTAGMTVFTFTQHKGGGNAYQGEKPVTCSFSQTATLADVLAPGETPPAGTSPSDVVTLTFGATAYQRP